METNKEKIEHLIEKLGEMKSTSGIDLSSGEDLSIALMNLVSIEEHLYFSAIKTSKQKYFDMLNSVREIRKELMQKIVKNPKGEEWCLSKHFLAASMRLIETGTKYLKGGKKEEAWNFFEKAFEIYSMFWAINLSAEGDDKVISGLVEKSNEKGDAEAGKINFRSKLTDMAKKIIDCCKE